MHKRELEALYPAVDIHARQFDASDEGPLKAVVDEALEKYGRLDIMFANAGVVGSHKAFGEIGGEEFMKTMRTNVLRCVPSSLSDDGACYFSGASHWLYHSFRCSPPFAIIACDCLSWRLTRSGNAFLAIGVS